MNKRVILILRLGVGGPTGAERDIMRDIIDINSDDTIACGAPLSGPIIPGLNSDGHLLSVISTELSAEEVSAKYSTTKDFLPVLCIDITDQVEHLEDGNISINAQMAETGLGKMLKEVFDVEPTGEFDKDAWEEKKAEYEKEDNDCDCAACQLKSELFGDIDGVEDVGSGLAVEGLDGLKNLLERIKALKERENAGEDITGKLEKLKSVLGKNGHAKSKSDKKEDGKGTKYKRKTCNLSLDELLDLVKKEGGYENLSIEQQKRLDELSRSLR